MRLLLAVTALLHAHTAAAVDVASCGDLSRLEKRARVGKLDDAQRACLQQALGSKPTDVNRRLSELLIADAYASGARDSWERLVVSHLQNLDHGDPELAFQYALHLLKKNGEPSVAAEWLDVAIDNRFLWDRKDRPTKLYNVLKLRTEAMVSLATAAERARATDSSEVARLKALSLRGRARLYSVDWARHARAIGRDTTEAISVCAASGWTRQDCQEAAAEPSSFADNP